MINIIPKVNEVIKTQGKEYRLDKDSLFYAPHNCSRAEKLLKKITGLAKTDDVYKSAIRLEIGPEVAHSEGYLLKISEDGILIIAKTEQGLFYGVQTLRQLLPESIEVSGITEPVSLPCLEIEDAPRFTYRGFMLDEARHFFGVDVVKRILDLLAMQKISQFHWHLTDHQGWRIEIKRYPNLTEIGSRRSKTQINSLTSFKPIYDDHTVSGFYTQEDIKEVVAYAQELFIDVIPEIDIPGHTYAALAAYLELSCDGKPVEVGAEIGLSSFLMLPKLICAGTDETLLFFQNVLDEIVALFPSKTIHLGSDEAGKKVWKLCPLCRARMKEEKLKNVNELQGYLINKLAAHLFQKGCQVICWNDGLYDNADLRITVQHWMHSFKRTLRHIKNGRKAIVSTMKPYYLDYTYRTATLKDTYCYEPYFKELSEKECKNILGIEAPLWTEYVKSRERLDWQVFPRLLAISETAWTEKENKNYTDFLERLAVMERRLALLDVNFTSKECYLKYKRSIDPTLTMLGRWRPPSDRIFEAYNKAK